jgi:hypothetical protein
MSAGGALTSIVAGKRDPCLVCEYPPDTQWFHPIRHATGTLGSHTSLWRLVEWERNACISRKIVGTGSRGHLLFHDGHWVAGMDGLSEPATSAHGAVVGRGAAVLLEDVHHARLVLRLAAPAGDPHNRERLASQDSLRQPTTWQQSSTCLQSRSGLSKTASHLGIDGSWHGPQTVSLGLRCGHEWWSGVRLASKNTVKLKLTLGLFVANCRHSTGGGPFARVTHI